nr:hypothetical protein [uncultured Methanobacterium sp.]
MGYLICDKCGGYYELQPGEKPEDFSDECECGGKLIYSDTYDVTSGNEDDNVDNEDVSGVSNEDVNEDSEVVSEDVYGDSEVSSEEVYEDVEGSEEVYTERIDFDEKNNEDKNIIDDSSGEELLIDNESQPLEDYKNSLMDKSYVKQIKLATQVQEILDIKGHYVIKGNGNLKFIKILNEGIETDNGQLIRFEDITDIEYMENDNSKPKISSGKSRIDNLISTGYQIFAPGKVTLKIISNKGEIELKEVKLNDAKRCVSFLKKKVK